jgi:urease accessory protein
MHVPPVPLPATPSAAEPGRPTPSAATLLMLTDSRLPSGAYAHSGGLEPLATIRADARADAGTARLGGVRTLGELRQFLDGRLHTGGLVAAAVAAAATGDAIPLDDLDVATSARMPSAAARQASRRQGRQLLRVAATAWPSPVYRRLARMPHHAMALGIVARVGGLQPVDAAVAAAYGAVSGPASAAVRLLALDPLAVQAVLTGLALKIDRVAAVAVAAAEDGRIPMPSAPLLELAAEDHATWEVRLFAS